MKVTISVGGKFHAFHLARQLQRRGYLSKIFTSYPWFKVKKEKIPKDKVICLSLTKACEYIARKIPYFEQFIKIRYYFALSFDLQVKKRIKPCDIFVGFGDVSLYTLRKARALGAKTVLECGSRHIESEDDILKEEYGLAGIKPFLPEPRMIKRKLNEYQEADYIVVPSTFAQESFLSKGFAENKIINVPLGLDTNTFRPVAKQDTVFRVVFAGFMGLVKGVHYLLQAVSELKLKGLETWLIGGIMDEARPFFHKYAGNFQYIGRVAQQQLPRYLSQGSVFVLFSIDEGFGMALLEAMACGLPVICSTHVGAKDAVRDGIDGFILPNRDVQGLKEKIDYLFRHPEVCREMGREARARVESGFTWEHYGERIISSYERILKNNETTIQRNNETTR